ncbi:hypothetical protein Gotur_013679 [Gossypium turneri]
MVKIIQDSHPINSSSTLVKKILQLLHSIEHWRIRHVSREDNRVVDSLTKMASDKDHNVQFLRRFLRSSYIYWRTPTTSCISGVTRRGFMMPRGVREPVAGCEAVARVTVRTMRTLVEGRRRREEEDLGEKETVWGEIKVERKAEEAAIFVSLEIVWRKKQ